MTAKDVINGSAPWSVERGDCLEYLQQLPEQCVHAAVTSPPYYLLRDYQTGTWEGGDPACSHKPSKEWLERNFTASCGLNIGVANQQAAGERRWLKANGRCRCGARRVDQQIGLEQTAEQYLARLVAVFAEVRRALRDDGVLWVNIGDSYASTGGRGVQGEGSARQGRANVKAQEKTGSTSPPPGCEAGDMLGIPWRLALAMQADGWLLRDAVVWRKPSAMPASLAGWRWERCKVKIGNDRSRTYKQQTNAGTEGQWGGVHPAQWTDCPGCKKCEPHGGYRLRKGSWRCTPAYEFVFMFAKSMGYFSDHVAASEPAESATIARDKYSRVVDDGKSGDGEQCAVQHDHETESGGRRNPRNVWSISAEPSKEKHYAAYPTKLVRKCLTATAPLHGVCAACGMGWSRVVETQRYQPDVCEVGARNVDESRGDKTRKLSGHDYNEEANTKTIGFRPSCNCNAGVAKPIILDLFAGTGTTLVEALRLGCRAIGVDLSGEYVGIARRRIVQDCPLFNGATT